MAVSAFCSLLGITIAPIFTRLFGKKKTYIAANLISILGMIVIALGGSYSVPLMFIGALFGYVGSGAGTPLIYSLLADTVEYGEWKSGIRAEGLVFSAASFGVKVGMGLGNAIAALLLTYGNYIANAVQTESSLRMIRLSYLYVPIVCMVCVTALLLFYKLEEALYDKIRKELIERRGVIEPTEMPMAD
jgi:GPH family glycoside/pentoside/hexuronide:cation symporter